MEAVLGYTALVEGLKRSGLPIWVSLQKMLLLKPAAVWENLAKAQEYTGAPAWYSTLDTGMLTEHPAQGEALKNDAKCYTRYQFVFFFILMISWDLWGRQIKNVSIPFLGCSSQSCLQTSHRSAQRRWASPLSFMWLSWLLASGWVCAGEPTM